MNEIPKEERDLDSEITVTVGELKYWLVQYALTVDAATADRLAAYLDRKIDERAKLVKDMLTPSGR